MARNRGWNLKEDTTPNTRRGEISEKKLINIINFGRSQVRQDLYVSMPGVEVEDSNGGSVR